MGNRAKYDVHNTNVVAVVLPDRGGSGLFFLARAESRAFYFGSSRVPSLKKYCRVIFEPKNFPLESFSSLKNFFESSFLCIRSQKCTTLYQKI